MLLSYENIWVRNMFFFAIICFIYFAESVFGISNDYYEIKTPVLDFVIIVLVFAGMFFNNQFIVRLYLLKNKIAVFIVFESVIIIIGTVIHYFFEIYSNVKMSLFSCFLNVITNLIMGISLYFFHLWIIQNVIGLKKKVLDNENELLFLKHQLNPHFLLNAMNNLYGVSLSEPDNVSDKILELSDLLRYQLEVVKKNEVLVADELDFCKNYISYTEYKSNNLKIETSISGDYQYKKIPTLLFLPLIENGVKFASETPKPFLKMSWVFDENLLTFTIINNYLDKNSKVNGTKIGLENLQRRLEILETNSELVITKNDFFTAQLKLWI